MPKQRTIFDRQTGEKHTITAISAMDAVRLHPEKWSLVPVASPESAEPTGGAEQAPSPAADDLTRIKGIGPSYQKALARHGVTTFADLAGLSPERIAAIDADLKMRDAEQIAGWVEQAKALTAAAE